MSTYIFLQHYWWLIVSLLGAILVFLLFVQGGNSLLFCLGKTEEHRKMMVNSTGRKWEFTFTTLVTFGGAFFASFPLFYSTSFGGAYWLWMIILFTFVLQAVSYEFQSKAGNLLGKKAYRVFLVLNGVVGPVLLGGAVATFFTGSAFYINKGNIADTMMPVISSWANAGHGLDALLNPWNVVLGLAVFFLARILGSLYFINNISDVDLVKRCRRALWGNTGLFLIFFLSFVIRTLLAEGYAVNPENGEIFMEPYKYLTNFIEMPVVLVVFLIGVLAGVCTGLIHVKFKVRDLLSGIIMMTALWTINLRLAGTANVPIFGDDSIFDNASVNGIFHDGLSNYKVLVIVLVIAVISKVLLDLYMKTKSGFLLRAVGDNDVLVTSLAKDQGNVKILGLAIANGLVALSGSIFCQEQRVFEISSGTGAIVIGLASVIIGTSLFKNVSFMKATTAVLIGSVIYKACVAAALKFFEPQDMKLITAVLFLVILVIGGERRKKVKKNARA